LIRKADLVVARGIKLIECAAAAAGRIAIAGRVIEFRKKAWSGFHLWQRVTNDSVAGKRPDLIRREGARLAGDFRTVIEVLWQFSNPAQTDSLEVLAAGDSRFA